MWSWQGSSGGDDGDEADVVCLCFLDAVPCCLIAPSFSTRPTLLSQRHPWCSCHLLPHCLSLDCRSQVGGLGRFWTRGGGCDLWRAEAAEEEGHAGRSDLFEFRRSGAVHRDHCCGDPRGSWGEKEKQEFLNSRGTLHVNVGTRLGKLSNGDQPCRRGRRGRQQALRGEQGGRAGTPDCWPGRNP